jgi:hypothetical protein
MRAEGPKSIRESCYIHQIFLDAFVTVDGLPYPIHIHTTYVVSYAIGSLFCNELGSRLIFVDSENTNNILIREIIFFGLLYVLYVDEVDNMVSI